jgi:hypothetical protein
MSGFEIPIALAVAGGAASAVSAVQQNRAVKKSMRVAEKNAKITRQQLGDAAELERRKSLQEAGRIRGRLRTSAAESGLDFTGAYTALERQAAIDEATNRAIIDQNEYNQGLRIASGLEADLASLASRGQNTILSFVQGGISGASTGLAIQSGIKGLQSIEPTTAPPVTTVGGSGGLPSFSPDFDATRLA